MSKDLDAAIESGIEEAKQSTEYLEAAQHALALKGKLTAAYNAANGVKAALEKLKNRAGSTFDYTIKEKGSSLEIETNIPVNNQDLGREDNDILKVSVYSEGQVVAHGDTRTIIKDGHMADGSEVVRADSQDVTEVVKFIAAKATIKGLIK